MYYIIYITPVLKTLWCWCQLWLLEDLWCSANIITTFRPPSCRKQTMWVMQRWQKPKHHIWMMTWWWWISCCHFFILTVSCNLLYNKTNKQSDSQLPVQLFYQIPFHVTSRSLEKTGHDQSSIRAALYCGFCHEKKGFAWVIHSDQRLIHVSISFPVFPVWYTLPSFAFLQHKHAED